MLDVPDFPVSDKSIVSSECLHRKRRDTPKIPSVTSFSRPVGLVWGGGLGPHVLAPLQEQKKRGRKGKKGRDCSENIQKEKGEGKVYVSLYQTREIINNK